METHEVVHVTIDGEEHEIIRLREKRAATSSKTKQIRSRPIKSTKPLYSSIKNRKRGWRGMDKITEFESSRGAFVFLLLICFAIIVIVQNPELINRDNLREFFENSALARNIVSIPAGIAALVSLYFSIFGYDQLIVCEAGLVYKHGFSRKKLIPWNQIKKFHTYSQETRTGLFSKSTSHYLSVWHSAPAGNITLTVSEVTGRIIKSKLKQYQKQFSEPCDG